MAAFSRSKHDPVLASGTVVTSASTGSVQFASPFPSQDVSVGVSIKGAALPTDVVALTYNLSADKTLISVYAWQADGSAAEVAVTVDVQVIRQ